MRLLEALDARRSWDEEERAVLEQTRRVADDVIAPNAAGYDESSEFPWKNVEVLREIGLNAIFVPTAYGGAPMSYAL